MIALTLVALLSSGCASVSGANFLGLNTSGGNASADSEYPTPAAPVILIPRSHYSAFTIIDPDNWPPESEYQRVAAAGQNHRTPKAKPPPHRFMIKPVAAGRLTSGHGYRLNPLSAKPKKHNGIDYAATRGTEVYAAGAGKVVNMYRSKSYGNYIRIRHANGYSTAYAHLNNFASGIKVGSVVEQGQTIGAVGSTGFSTGNHLHFELIHKGRFVDPLSTHADAIARTKTKLAGNKVDESSLAHN